MLKTFFDAQSTLVLDGGLATELEQRGHNLNDPLWSAKFLVESPEEIASVHRDYLYAGADCVITASYQATLEGFQGRGFSEDEARALILKSVDLAVEVRDAFWRRAPNRRGRQKPLVAASVGPYGAFLANGAEYTGDYDLDVTGLVAWHRPRWELLASSKADLLACETIPSRDELSAYLILLETTPDRHAWLSFTCKDEVHISDGTRIRECAALVDRHPQVEAIGINCTAPNLMPSLIAEIEAATAKPIIVYPNSGEAYDPVEKVWTGTREAEEFGTAAREWRKLGAAIIGGCCRTTPKHIRAISERLKGVGKG